jgi:integrase
MATLKAVIKKDKQRADKTWNVLIRFTHDQKIRYISTTMYVTKSDLTKSYMIKNQQIIDKCNELIKVYRNKILELNLELNDMDIDCIVDYLKSKDDNNNISFTLFAEEWCKKHTEIKSIMNYVTSLNSFKSFFQHDNIMCHEITVKKMKAFEDFLSDKKRAKSLYTSCIVRLFNEARNYYNDEDNDIIRIKQSLKKYVIPQQNVAEKRALSEDVIRNIFELTYDGKKNKGNSSLHDLALDCFKLSFCLMGINSADLYNAMEINDEYLIYERTKTKDRRSDHAKMIVRIHPIIKELVDKYRDNKRAFNFYDRYSSLSTFNQNINKGLKQVGNEVGIEDLTYYSARHSMATIAINKVRINKYIVNDMLCHTDTSMRMTDLYIEKDFAPINEANFKLLDYVFKEKDATK